MSVPERNCLGCGVNTDSKKSYDRRVLCSIAGEQVRETWKKVMSAKLTSCELELDLDSVVGTQDNPGYITCVVHF